MLVVTRSPVGTCSTMLPSGDVLVVGGYGDGAERTNAETYDPGTDAWSPAGTLVNTRFSHTTTALALPGEVQ